MSEKAFKIIHAEASKSIVGFWIGYKNWESALFGIEWYDLGGLKLHLFHRTYPAWLLLIPVLIYFVLS